jgi:hypothetical protein
VTLTSLATMNPVLVTSTGAISGGNYGIVVDGEAGWTITNMGVISGLNRGLAAGATTSSVALTNSGTIDTPLTGTSASIAVNMNSGVVTNTGVILGNQFGVKLVQSGSVANTGTIAAGGTVSGQIGVFMGGGGTLDNGTAKNKTGIISVVNGVGVEIAGTASTKISDFGSISGSVGIMDGAPGTVLIAGSVTGTAGDAIQLTSSADVLALAPSAKIGGKVVGTVGDTLVLAHGVKIGTIDLLGSRFTNFQSIVVDKNATWDINGHHNRLGANESISFRPDANLRVQGTLDALSGLAISGKGLLSINGVLEVGGHKGTTAGAMTIDAKATASIATTHLKGAIIDNGSLLINKGAALVSGNVTGKGDITLNAGARLDVVGALSATSTTFVAGAGATLGLGKPGSVSTGMTISGFAAGDKIDLLQVSATITGSNTGPSLTLSNGGGVVSVLHFSTGSYHFTTATDNHGGTLIQTT